ncbi:MAG: hypothetical protein EOO89_26525 [Pedobacter sp.]|nr:MAG: hypothetical protein EOO89_26525 [Pedobacter sp.]
MKILMALFFGLCLSASSALGQQAEIDAYCQRIDSTIAAATNIGEFIVRHPSDSDTTRLYDRYFIDTVNLVLLKSIYDGNYYAKEYIQFYYRDTQLVRTNARHELDDKKYAGVFYYQQGRLITLANEPGTTGSYAFDISELERTGKQYLRNSTGIFDLIRRNRHSEGNRHR